MAPRWNVAVDTLAENLRWLLSQKGIDILRARSDYLTDRKLAATDGVDVIKADDARSLLVSILSEAEPVYWPAAFCTILEQSYGTLPMSWRLTDPMLFTQRGFIHLEQPISLKHSHPPDDACMGTEDRVTSLSWRKSRNTTFIDLCAWVQPGEQSIMEVFPPTWMTSRLSKQTYNRLDRLIRKTQEEEETKNREAVQRLAEQFGSTPEVIDGAETLLRSATNEDVEQEAYRQMMLTAHRETSVIRPGGIPWLITPWRSGQTIAQTMEKNALAYSDPSNACPYCTEGYLKLFGAALNFLSTKVFVSVPSHTDRAVLRRLARGNAKKPQWDTVNVVTLRKPERVKHASDEEEVHREWSCHWLVGSANGGFWRHQPMKNEEGQWIKQWRWISAYVKGDMSKPFKPPSKRVFTVER